MPAPWITGIEAVRSLSASSHGVKAAGSASGTAPEITDSTDTDRTIGTRVASHTTRSKAEESGWSH
jgi:hypothetical protein